MREDREQVMNPRTAVAQSVAHGAGGKTEPAKALLRQRGYRAHTFNGQEREVAFLYVMECAGYAKVGLTNNITDRLRKLIGGCPLPVRHVYSKPLRAIYASWAEHQAHAALWDFHDHDEWFTSGALKIASRIVSVCANRVNEIPPNWTREGNRVFDWVPHNVHTASLMKAADKRLFPYAVPQRRCRDRHDMPDGAL